MQTAVLVSQAKANRRGTVGGGRGRRHTCTLTYSHFWSTASKTEAIACVSGILTVDSCEGGASPFPRSHLVTQMGFCGGRAGVEYGGWWPFFQIQAQAKVSTNPTQTPQAQPHLVWRSFSCPPSPPDHMSTHPFGCGVRHAVGEIKPVGPRRVRSRSRCQATRRTAHRWQPWPRPPGPPGRRKRGQWSASYCEGPRRT